MQYLVSVIDDGQSYAAGRTDSATQAESESIDVFNDELIKDGYWVFAAGLSLPAAATVVDNREGTPTFTDGPYVETKEFAAGIWIWECPDLDVALKLAESGSKACNRKLEVRAILQAPDA